MRTPALCVALFLPLALQGAEYAWEQAQRTQRAFDAQKAVRDYTSDYICRETSGRNTPSTTWRPRREDDYRRPSARADTPYIPPPKTPPVPGTTEYKIMQARSDRSRPAGVPRNRSALIRFFQKHGFSLAEAESWADLDISVNSGFRSSRSSGQSSTRVFTREENAQMAADWDALRERTRRESDDRRAADAAQHAAVLRRAESGEAVAFRELSSLGDYTSDERLMLLEKAAALGDRVAVRLAFDWRYQNGAYYNESKLEPLAKILAEEQGYAPAATLLAEMLAQQPVPDLPGAVKLLERAYSKNSDARLAEPLVIFYRDGGPGLPADADQAMAWGERAIARTTLALASMDLIRSLPVTEKHAPRILAILHARADQRENDFSKATAAADLARIYSGESEAWRPFVPTDQEKAFSWHARAAEARPSYYPGTISFYVEAGDLSRAEKLSEAAAKTNEGDAVMAAAAFWAERTDGKADGERAETLYRRCLPSGNLGTYNTVRRRIGDIYRYGLGRPVLLSKAIEWYENGYANQEIASVRVLAECLFRGIGVARDEERALKILNEAANYRTTGPERCEAGFDALLLQMEQGSHDQTENAIRELWLKRWPQLEKLSADTLHSHPRADSLLGALLVGGTLGGREDEFVAKGWQYLERAAAAGDTRAEAMVAERLLGRWDERPRGGNNDEDRERALTLLTQATKKGSGRAGTMLGIAQYEGWGLPADEKKGLAWFDWAIEHGWHDAVKSRIHLLMTGKTVRDVPAAMAALESEAKGGDRWAQNTLGIYLWRGEGVPQNTASALEWLDQAAANGEWFSARSAAKIRMLGGPNLSPSGSSAIDALERYSEERGPQAMVKLAQLYAGDAAVSPWFPPDLAKAALWFRKA
ncbi:MAG TPA: hypothetical protein VL069_13610 [Opitutus sp.]|nr:hypothetical protein [Opitutus sp.]